MLHRSKIEHMGEYLAKKIDDITMEDALSYELIFPGFHVISLEEEVLENIRNGLKFPNTLGLESGRKYLVKDGNNYVSLIEEREGEVRICANNLE